MIDKMENKFTFTRTVGARQAHNRSILHVECFLLSQEMTHFFDMPKEAKGHEKKRKSPCRDTTEEEVVAPCLEGETETGIVRNDNYLEIIDTAIPEQYPTLAHRNLLAFAPARLKPLSS